MVDEARAAVWTRTDSKVLQVLSSVLAQQNRTGQAVAILECVLAADPGNTDVRRALSGLYLELERFADALALADAALGESPERRTRANLMLVRSHALWGLGREQDAQQQMRRYVEERRES